ncbi:multiple epidermal growth factor-like domains protein 8 isoform X5 [Symsagittifera roscoffensis]|uniref:multiple epidermal growth factor-like domains protein 8 isoform X5 n=1 Tax=Symsagittifera roscoffensis TaxID=84072 RepID=UPI00307C7CF8
MLFPKCNLLILLIVNAQYVKSKNCRDDGPVRIVLSEEGASGNITDGDEAINSAHCEWLIERNETSLRGASVSVQVTQLETECGYDNVFVQEVDRLGNFRLIGALSGLRENITLTSDSGKLHIHMFTDVNFFLKGFNATYSINKCPNNCSGHGQCKPVESGGYKCQCQQYPVYVGKDCSFRQCAEKCWAHKAQGECARTFDKFGQSRQFCKCNSGNIGETCSLNLKEGGEDIWYRLQSHKPWEFTGRMSSASVYVKSDAHPSEGAIYVFGGFNLSSIMDEFLIYDFSQNQWRSVEFGAHNGLKPPPTMGHTMTAVAVNGNHDLVIIGGRGDNPSEHSKEIFYFNTGDNIWRMLPNKGPDVAWHTANLVGKCLIYIVGGRRSDYSYNDEVHILDWCDNDKRWKFNVRVNGLKASVLQLVGHSTVYVERYRSLFIFGGFTPISVEASERRNNLFVFNTEQNFLSEWATGHQTEAARPPSMAYHTATVLGNYMVIFGGTAYSHKRKRDRGADDMCYGNELYFLHLDCVLWTDKSNLSPSDKVYAFEDAKSKFADISPIEDRGPPLSLNDQRALTGLYDHLSIQSRPPSKRYGHMMLNLTENVLLVIGGFDGTPLGDMYAFKVSELVVPSDTSSGGSGSPCTKVNNEQECLGHPECAWCRNKKGMGIDSCLHRNSNPKQICGSEDNFLRSYCPGVCSALTDCQSCALWGSGQVNQVSCGWCAHTRKCMPKNEIAACINDAEIEQWNGYLKMNKDPMTNQVPFIDSFDSCQKAENFRGIILEERQYPQNEHLPHGVYFLTDSERYQKFMAERLLRLPKDIWGSVKNEGNQEDVIVYSTSFNVSFQTKQRDEKFQLDVVTTRALKSAFEISNEQGYSASTQCIGDSSEDVECLTKAIEAYSDVKINYEYKLKPLEIEGQRSGFTMGLRIIGKKDKKFELIPSSYIFPAVLWTQEECESQKSCFACLRNPACGWYSSSDRPVDAQCYHKSGTSKTLVIAPEHCVNCSDFTSCTSCVDMENNQQCIWWQQDAVLIKGEHPRCIEKPPVDSSIAGENPTRADQCHNPCTERKTCGDCTSKKDPSSHCAWCDDPPVCFPFQSYLTSFPYGSCKSWVDSSLGDHQSKQLCKSCSEHTTCADCVAQFGCGYCYSDTSGVCVSGNFLPGDSNQNAYCRARLPRLKNVWNYTYNACPVENCLKTGCDKPFSCERSEENAEDYECRCPTGTTLSKDGTSCEETCDPLCIHGVCVEVDQSYKCKCFQGYTGKDCNRDCGCNKRANCTSVGRCGQCETGYKGSRCDQCDEMYFKSEKSDKYATVCQPCECNGHGVGCDASGECTCVNNTIGRNCEKCAESYYGDPRNGGICYKGCSSGQAVLTNTQGIIYLGSKGGSEITNAKNMSSCIWKITHSKQSGLQDKQPSFTPWMVLKITRINVLCNYQFVNVYDGEPSNVHGINGDSSSLDDSPSSRPSSSVSASSSRLLGSFCGRTTSDQTPERVVIAKSGVMTIVFNTKKREGTGTNALQFFEAEHTVLTAPCPDKKHFKETSGSSASGSSICTCADGWGGHLCRVPLCDNSAGRPCANGKICLPSGLCDCWPTYFGSNCTEEIKEPPEIRRFEVKTSDKFAMYNLEYDDLLEDAEGNSEKARSGHSMVALSNQIFIIGGNLAKSPTSPPRIMTFNTIERTLDFFTNAGLHNNIHYSLSAAAIVEEKSVLSAESSMNKKVNAVFIYGGFGSGLSISGSMQVQYLADVGSSSITDSSMSMNYVEVPNWVPKLVGHTMTAAKLPKSSEQSILLIIGGYSPDEGYNNMTILYHVDTSKFVALQLKGDYPLGIYCHSTVYYRDAEAFYVYGGMLYDTWGSQKVDLSRTLFLVTIESRSADLSEWKAVWTIIKPKDGRTPPKMMLHKSVVVNDYMVVLGGRTHDHDFTNKTYIYQLKCNTWMIPGVNLPSDSFVNLGLWEPVIGHDAVAIGNKIYIFGGFNGRYLSRVVSLLMPLDICNLLSTKSFTSTGRRESSSVAMDRCFKVSGCMYCSEDQSCKRYEPGNRKCMPNRDSLRGTNACHSSIANSKVNLKPTCEALTSCTECLAPDPFSKAPSPCHWCKKCQMQRCISKGLSCNSLQVTCENNDFTTYSSREFCPEHNVCVASTCSQCMAIQDRQQESNDKRLECIFTQNARSESNYEGSKQVINANPIFDWSCQKYYSQIGIVRQNLGDYTKFGGATTLETCPRRCSEYLDCKSCLDSRGGSDSGWRSCFWATGLDRCISPTFEPVLCLDGVCDMVVRGSADQCPKPCESFSRCIDCVNMRHCGYCSLQSSNPEIGGRGICLAGNLDGPNSEGGRCTSDSVISAFIQERDESSHPGGHGGFSPIGQLPGEFDGLSGHQWGYQSCSDENECRNGHHDCDLEREVCEDCKRDKEACPLGYLCQCKDKYKRNENTKLCEPQCDPECGPHGACSAPDVCDCDFGYAGDRCLEKCACNENSNCDIKKPIEDPKYCTKCLFSTNSEETKCSQCNATYYGVATNLQVQPQSRCKSCLDLCNNKTSICYWDNLKQDESKITVESFTSFVGNEGPSTDSKEELKCYGCSDNTEGQHCEKCRAGYRKKKQSANLFTCVLCNCNYHGARNNSCSEDDGSACQCTGHTRSPEQCDKDPKCRIQKQCSLCDQSDPKAQYIGSGVDGQQCYRKMHSTSNTYFLDPDNSEYFMSTEESEYDVHDLSPGQAAFFHVQPKYRNVNIRITIEISYGLVDVYLTKSSKIIRMRSSSQTSPNVDQISLLDPLNDKVQFAKLGPVASNEIETGKDANKSAVSRSRRSTLTLVSDEENEQLSSEVKIAKSEKQSQILEEEQVFFYRANQSGGKRDLFVRMQHENSILYGLNISGRFVIELPHDKFVFNQNRFFIAVHNAQPVEKAHGIIYQQQLHNSWRVVHILTILIVCCILTVFLTVVVYCIYIRLSQPEGFVNPNRHGRNLYSAASPFGSGSPFVPVDFLFSEYNFQSQPVSNIIPRSGKNAQRYFTVDSRMKNKYTPSIIGYQILKKNDKMRVGTVMFELPGKNFNLCFGSAVISVCDKFPIIETIPNTPSMTISRKSNTLGNPSAASSTLSFMGQNPIYNSTISTPHHASTLSHAFDPPLKKGHVKNSYLTVDLPPVHGGASPSRLQQQVPAQMFLQGAGLQSGSISTLTNRQNQKRKEKSFNGGFHNADSPLGLGGPTGGKGFNQTPSPKSNVFSKLALDR